MSAGDGHARSSRAPLFKFLLLAAAVLIVLLLIGLIPRLKMAPEIVSQTKSESGDVPELTVAKPLPAAAVDSLTVPGNIQAVEQTSINARATGYLRQWTVDIGDRVKRGQVLATIDSPEADQDLAQARAQLAQSQASVAQARANLTSMQGNYSQQIANLARADASLAQAQQTLAQQQAQVAQARQNANQSEAQVEQAQTNLDLAQVTANRYKNLAKEGAIDQQTADQTWAAYQTNISNVNALKAAYQANQANIAAYQAAVHAGEENVASFKAGVAAAADAVKTARADVSAARSAVTATVANVDSNMANVRRAQAGQSYEKVIAPFDGVITARNVDNGGLISAGGGGASSGVGSSNAGVSASGNAAGGGLSMGSSALGGSSGGGSSAGASSGGSASGSLFSIAQLGLLRVYVNIPQEYYSVVHVGLPARITVAAFPGRTFPGVVARTAGAIDPVSRTLVAEVQLQNQDNLLSPGMFGEVALAFPHTGAKILAPDSAIFTTGGGTAVLVATPQNTVRVQHVQVGRDFGTMIEIRAGLRPTDNIVTDPNSAVRNGEKIVAIPIKLKRPASAS